MKITEYAPYITGKEFLGELKKEPFRLDEKAYEEAYHEIASQYYYDANMRRSNTPKHFFELYPEVAKRLPNKQMQEEIFYALKNGRFSPEVPSVVIYALDKCKVAGSMNLFPLYFSVPQLRNIFSKGYFANGITLQDVIRSNYDKDFEPVSEWKLRVNSMTEGFKDVYVGSTNMIAILPNAIADVLSNDDIRGLEVKRKELKLYGDSSIFEIGGLVGASRSTYDLREAR